MKTEIIEGYTMGPERPDTHYKVKRLWKAIHINILWRKFTIAIQGRKNLLD